MVIVSNSSRCKFFSNLLHSRLCLELVTPKAVVGRKCENVGSYSNIYSSQYDCACSEPLSH
jgi:hypothetical protein